MTPGQTIYAHWASREEFPPARVANPTMADIVARVAAEHGLSVKDIKGNSLRKKHTMPRQQAMWEIAQQERWSLTGVGRFLGGRDHTTVLHGIRAHERRLAEACQ